jgi:CHAT domain-containing protein/tetratricopeptide (TPR) repeat protein
MRTSVFILALLLSSSLSAQKWERLEKDFRQQCESQEYRKAGETAAKQVNFAIQELDSTDVRYARSYYNLALAYHELGSSETARPYLSVAYNLMAPFYANHGTEMADICALFGRIDTRMGFHESAYNFLAYARDVRAAVYGKESHEYLMTLYDLADLAMAKADWEQMVSILVDALDIHDRNFRKDRNFASYANFLGLVYLNNGDNREAAGTFHRALEAYDEPAVEKDFTFAHLSNNLGLALYYLLDYGGAARYFGQADSLYRILLDGYSENYMMLLNNLASLYYSWGKPDRAGEAYRHMESYLEANPDHTDLNYILAVENAGNYHEETGDLKAAEHFYKLAIEIRRKTDPVDRRELAGALMILSSLYSGGKRPELSVEPALEAYGILAGECAPGDPDLVTALMTLGYNYQQAGQPNRALYYYELARGQIECSANSSHTESAIVYNNMGMLYLEQERLKEAVPCLERAHELEPGDPDVLYNLGYAYYSMNDPEGSKEMFERAKEVYAGMYGRDHPEYATALVMGVMTRGGYEDLDEVALEELRDAERIFIHQGRDTVSAPFMDCIDAFRMYYYKNKDFRKALEYGERALVLAGKIYGTTSFEYAENLLGQAGLYSRLRDRENLEKLYRDTERIASRLDGHEKEMLFYLIESSKRSNYYYLEEYGKARRSADRVVESDKARFLENQANMTLQERSRYLGNLTSLIDYNDYLMYFPDDSEVISNAVNNRLFLKSILLDAERLQKKALAGSGDTTLVRLHAEYTDRKILLSNLRSQFGEDRRILDSLEQVLQLTEREISRRLAGAMEGIERSFRWQDIRDKLREDEAAVEIVFFYHTTPPPVVTFHPWYLAFVITHEMKDHPLFLKLYDAPEVIPDYEAYRKAVETPGAADLDAGIYERLWARIDSAIAGKKTVYLSPDGLFNKVNVEALRDRDGLYVMDKYLVRNVYSLADLLQEQPVSSGNRVALLAGDPSFMMARDNDPVPAEATRGLSDFQTRMFPGTRLTSLPGTRTEVDSIGSMLDARGWQLSVLTGPAATEDAVVSVKNPRVLHLATHGFFAETRVQLKDTISGDEMRSYNFQDAENQSRSCLFLAGAQNTLFYAYDYEQGKADGILSSWEIAEMELDSTELVVLSACETGLGDVLNSEGVTGLRRAFHLAGARRILLSLWEVDDQATQLLMREFYAHWLSGMDLDASLAAAKRYLINGTPYSHPRYWAGFILTGI